MKEYDMAEVQKQWYDRDGWPLDLNAVYAINEFKGDSSDMADVQKWYLDGGPGSGNWGHQGRPGIRGGSGPGGGVAYRLNTPSGGYTGLVGAYKENESRNKKNGKTEPKKSEEPKESQFMQALKSGKCTAEDVGHAEIGDAVKLAGYDYVKYSDNKWLSLETGNELTQDDIKMMASSNTFKLSGIKPSDKTITMENKELDDVTKEMTDVDDIHAAVDQKMKEFPVGSMYKDADGNAYVKISNGKWVYSGKSGNMYEADVRFNIANDCATRAGVEEKSRFRDNAQRSPIAYNEPKKLNSPISENEIIDKLSGPDLTKGSCASLAFAYAGQKAGIDVIDYRGGESQNYFSRTRASLSTMKGIDAKTESAKSDIASARKLLKEMPDGKEHILMAGRHAAVVKKENGKLFYLEMQGTKSMNGWQEFSATTLTSRFSCKKSHTIKYVGPVEVPSLLINVESLGKSKEFQKTLGYINTAANKQQKGVGGYAK